MLLFAFLAVFRFVVVMLVPLVKGKFARIWIAGVLELLIGFYIATNMADLYLGAPPREAEEPAAKVAAADKILSLIRRDK